jgi:hypothetical protein
MKKLLVALCLTCALALTATAGAKGKRHEKQLTDEQKTVMKDMLAKYDANKDGKLDKTERAKINAEDKEKMKKAGLLGHKKKEGETK